MWSLCTCPLPAHNLAVQYSVPKFKTMGCSTLLLSQKGQVPRVIPFHCRLADPQYHRGLCPDWGGYSPRRGHNLEAPCPTCGCKKQALSPQSDPPPNYPTTLEERELVLPNNPSYPFCFQTVSLLVEFTHLFLFLFSSLLLLHAQGL